jgi:hypothetical protein
VRVESAGNDAFEVKRMPLDSSGSLASAVVADLDLDGANELVLGGTGRSGPGGGGIRIFESPTDDQYEIVYEEFEMRSIALVADARVGRGSPYPLVALGSFGGSELAGQIWFWRYDGQAYDRIEHMASG